MQISNDLKKTNIGYTNLKSNTSKNNTQNPITNEASNLPCPCDAKYLLKRSDNINFCAKYKIKKLQLPEFNKIQQEMMKKAESSGIHFDFFTKDHVTKYNEQNSDIIVQTLNILFDHKIFELESVKDQIHSLILHIGHDSSPLSKINDMFEFADFMTSDMAKNVYKNESVQDEMGNILYNVMMCDSVDYKKKFVKYLNEHSELLTKDAKIGKYIEAVDKELYDTVLNNLLKKEPPIDPREGFKIPERKLNGLFGDIFGTKEKTEEALGKVVTKCSEGKCGFARIGGQGQAIEQLEDLVIFPMRYPQFYKGINTEKGAILFGPPGTGKSLMAQALAEELERYYVKIGSTDMENEFVGGTQKKWRKLFDELKEHQPSLLFIDEIDALGKKRGGTDVHGDKELNCFLKLVSDIKAENLDVFILGATNNFKALDPAILRDGRFGAHIEMLPPQTVKDVEEIFNIHTDKLMLDIEDMKKNKDALFKMMLDLGLSGSAIEGVVLDAHKNLLKRTGIRDKMKARTITKADEENFKFKASDFFEAIKNRDEANSQKRKPIGFR